MATPSGTHTFHPKIKLIMRSGHRGTRISLSLWRSSRAVHSWGVRPSWSTYATLLDAQAQADRKFDSVTVQSGLLCKPAGSRQRAACGRRRLQAWCYCDDKDKTEPTWRIARRRVARARTRGTFCAACKSLPACENLLAK